MAIGDLAKQIQESSDSRLRERLREVDPMSPAWSGIIAELEWRASQQMHRQTRALVCLTWAIAILTFVLLLYTTVAALISFPMRCHSVRCGMAGRTQSSNAIGYAKFYSRSHNAVIRVYDEAGNIIGTHEQTGQFRGPVSIRAGAPPSRLVETLSLGVAKVSEKLTFSICHVKTSG